MASWLVNLLLLAIGALSLGIVMSYVLSVSSFFTAAANLLVPVLPGPLPVTL